MEDHNYEDDIHIDESALDVEWLRQADLMHHYASHAAKTDKALGEAKEALEHVTAKLEMQVRNETLAAGVKATEGAIKAAVQLMDEHVKAAQALIDAKYENDIAEGVVKALDQKKSALENLVRLLGVSYFAGPNVPHDLSRDVISERERKAINARVRIRTNGRKQERP